MSGYNKEMINSFGSGEYLNPKPLVATDVHKEYGERVVLDKVSVSINTGDRIGFVGANGAGKTTLLRILIGEEIADSGSISRDGIRIGYLAQDFTVDGGKTVYEVATEGVTDLVEAAEEFERMSQDYKADDPDFVNKYDYLLNLLQTNNAFDLSDGVQTVLDHLDVGRDMDAKVSTLSGGQTMRLALARLLISRPDILVLDEPTNHLDLHANLWLREFLSEWQGGLLVVSHDRDFLNEVTTDTWELADGNGLQDDYVVAGVGIGHLARTAHRRAHNRGVVCVLTFRRSGAFGPVEPCLTHVKFTVLIGIADIETSILNRIRMEVIFPSRRGGIIHHDGLTVSDESSGQSSDFRYLPGPADHVVNAIYVYRKGIGIGDDYRPSYDIFVA